MSLPTPRQEPPLSRHQRDKHCSGVGDDPHHVLVDPEAQPQHPLDIVNVDIRLSPLLHLQVAHPRSEMRLKYSEVAYDLIEDTA